METPVGQAWETLKATCASDDEYAWALHCNLAMPILDAIGTTHEKANQAAAFLMQHLFDHDITQNPLFQYGKSCAQAYTEIRIAAEQAEDAAP